MFLKYFLIGLGSAGVVGVGGYAVYHEVSKKNINKDAKSEYGTVATVTPDGRALSNPTLDTSVKSVLSTSTSK